MDAVMTAQPSISVKQSGKIKPANVQKKTLGRETSVGW